MIFNNKLRLLALSSSRVNNSAYLATAFPYIIDFLGAEKLQIAFVPFAMANGNYEDYAQNVREGLSSLPHNIITVTRENAKTIIQDADVIMIGGGNTFKLVHDLHAYDLISLIREKVNTGTPYIGWSAGSNILAPGLFTTNDMPIIQPKSFEALNILPFQINPHYNNELPDGHRGETRDQRLEEFLTLNPKKYVIGLVEGTGLLVQGGEMKVIGEEDAFCFSMINDKIKRGALSADKVITGL